MSFASLNPLLGSLVAYIYMYAPFIALASLLLVLVLCIFHLRLRRRLSRLALGRAGSLEESIQILTRDTKDLQSFRGEVEKYLKIAEVRMSHSISGIGVVRFNALSSTAGSGNLSSAVAFIDERGSGMVLSTLYARDRVAVYTKPVENGSSSHELTEEERQAIEKALASVKHPTRS